MASKFPRIMLVGPLPPPSGGMANQCEQLYGLLDAEGYTVNFVQTNSPYRPNWVASIQHVRAIFRLIPYIGRIWHGLRRSDVVHLFANSGIAWYVYCLPVLIISRIRKIPCIVNYRGGDAERFFKFSPKWVRNTLSLAEAIVTPSEYLARVFKALGYTPLVIPNIVNLERFSPALCEKLGDRIHLIVTRNLEPIYDIPTALRAFSHVFKVFPNAFLTIAGSGPEEEHLKALAIELGIGDSVRFSGRIPNQDIPDLYESADVVLNPSTIDNMPISILEGFACGLPVVTTDAGGIPFLVKHKENALLVGIGDADAMAESILLILTDQSLAKTLRKNALAEARKYSWSEIRPLWLGTYQQIFKRTGESKRA